MIMTLKLCCWLWLLQASSFITLENISRRRAGELDFMHEAQNMLRNHSITPPFNSYLSFQLGKFLTSYFCSVRS